MTLPESRREDPKAASGDALRSASSGVVVSPLASSLPGRGPAEPATWATTFAAGEVVGERYRVVRFIAAGGMGEVYEAFDEKLHTTVALKTLRWERLGDAHAEERLRREIAFSHRITHPNVARVFDVGYHRVPSPAGVDRPLMFLTMELLRGETLSDRITREGPLPLDVIRGIARGIADALEAAHAERIVHRDLKGSNVVLVASPSGSLRAVVTDFGLARTLESTEPNAVGGLSPSVSKDARFIGSPGYMAPEQVSGQPVTPRTDVYAFGVVLYEMATGHLPFRGDNVLATATMRLTQPPVPPRTYAPALPELWERVILTCLEREPARRYARASDVVAALDEVMATNVAALPPPTPRGGAAPLPLPAARVPSSERRNVRWPLRTLGGTLLVGLLAAGAVVAARKRAASSSMASSSVAASSSAAAASASSLTAGSAGAAGGAPGEAPVVVRPSVGVVGFRHLGASPQDAWLQSALTEMLRSEIGASPGVRVVSGEAMASAQRDLGFSLQEEPSREALTHLGTQVGATYTMHGSYLAVGTGPNRRLRVDVVVFRTGESERLATVSEVGTDASLFDMVSRAAVALRTALRIDEPPARALSAARAALPGNTVAARAYLEGLDALRREDMAGARRALARAVQLEPTFGPAHLALSEAHQGLGFLTLAREQLELPTSLPVNATREQQLLFAAHKADLENDAHGVRNAYDELSAKYPDNVDYGVALARALMRTREHQRAHEVLNALAALPPSLAQDPRIPLVGAELERQRGEHKAEERKAQEALKRARTMGARALEALALTALGKAQTTMGQASGWDALGEAERIFMELGLRGRAARTLMIRAGALADVGDIAASRSALDKALALARALDDANVFGTAYLVEGVLARHSNQDARRIFVRCAEHMARLGFTFTQLNCVRNVALEDRTAGKLAEARRGFEESAGLARRIHNPEQEAFARDDSAVAWLKLGHPEDAIRIHEELRPIFAAAGSPLDEAINLQHLGAALTAVGRFDDARRVLEEAEQGATRAGAIRSQAYTVMDLAALDAVADRPEEAHQRLRQAMTIAEQHRIEDLMDVLKLRLVTLDLEEGETPTDALRALDDGEDAEIAASLALSLARQGRSAEAMNLVARAQREVVKAEDLPLRVSVLTRLAEASLASGRPREGMELLRSGAADAKRAGFLELSMRAELTLLRCERSSTRGTAFDAGLAELETRARSAGLLRLARHIADAKLPFNPR